MQDEKTGMKRNLYQMTMDKNFTLEMVGRLARFYVKERTVAGLDNFISSFYGTLREQNVPWLDIPFFINAMDGANFPKVLREKWAQQGLVGSMRISPEKREKMSVEYFMDNKQEIIQLYMDLLEMYLGRNDTNLNMLTLESIAHALQMDGQEDELRVELEKQISLYNILGNIRVMERDFTRYLAKNRTKKPSGIHSDVTFDGEPDQHRTTNKSRKQKKREGQEPPKTERLPRLEKPPMDKGTDLSDDDSSVNLPLPNAGKAEAEKAAEAETNETAAVPVKPEEPSAKDETQAEPPKKEEPKAEPLNTEETKIEAPKAEEPENAQPAAPASGDAKEGGLDCLDLFNQMPPESPENDEAFEMGDNTFEDETGTPPTGLANKPEGA